MKLYLNEKIEVTFPLVRELDILIKEMINNPKYNYILDNLESIDLVRHTIDPVQVFIDYWIQDVNTDSPKITPKRQQYIKNVLYAAKGAPEVFNAIERCFEIQSEWTYEFPIIEVWKFETIRISNVATFVNKIKYLLYHLLYYTELNLYIKNLIYTLKGDLVNNNAVITKGFTITKTEWDENDIF